MENSPGKYVKMAKSCTDCILNFEQNEHDDFKSYSIEIILALRSKSAVRAIPVSIARDVIEISQSENAISTNIDIALPAR